MPVCMSYAAVFRTAISAERIVDAMASAGLVVKTDQIELLSRNSATINATMRVVSVGNLTAGTVKAKLRCRDNRECLPFYVLVHGVDGIIEGSQRLHPALVNNDSSLPTVVRGGDHATLILESPDSRMSMPVICMQSGMRGQRIRVTSLDRKRFYDVEVIAAGILKGSY